MTLSGADVRRAAHAAADKAALAYFRRARDDEQDLDDRGAMHDRVGVALAVHRDLGHADEPSLAHPAPAPIDPDEARWKRRRAGGVAYHDVTFPSPYAPEPADPASGEWSSVVENHDVHVWILQHDEPRPWLVCVHGTSMGRPRIDLGFFRALWLHRRLGLNVAIPVLPLHGPRRDPREDPLSYPSRDVVTNLHGSRQSVSDVRRTIALLRSVDDQPVGLFGISLGGHVAALVAGFDEDLAAVIVGAPAVDLAELVSRHDPGPPNPAFDPEAEAALSAIASPLSFPCRVPRDRRFLYAGAVDGLVDPSTHADALWEHWGEPDRFRYEAGHLALAFHRPIGRYVARSLRSAGLVTHDTDEPSTPQPSTG